MGKNRGKLSYICIYIGSILILALKSEISGSLVGLSALHPQHSFVSPAVSRFSGPPTPTPNRWCCWCYLWSLAEIQVVQWILPFRILWRWLKVDGTPFTWYFRITKITKLLSGGLKLRSKTLAAGIVARCGEIGGSRLPWRSRFDPLLLLPYGTEFTGVPWELNAQ